jgi:UDP-glucose 4-epimerase
MHSLSNLSCCVLGAGSFIGTNLCERLVGKVGQLRGFRRPSGVDTPTPGIDWIFGDFLNARDLAAAVEGMDVVFHLVNATTPASANADMANDVTQNVLGSLGLMEACRRAGVKRLVYISSGGTIYGVPTAVPTPETTECWPITAYGISKLTIERYLHLHAYHHGLDYRVLRVANPYGPHQTSLKGQGAIGAFLEKAMSNQPIEVWGDGSAARDYVYVEDVAAALELAALHEGEERVFNIGSGVPRSLNEIIEAIGYALGKDIPVERKAGRGIDIPVSCLDISRAERDLGWTPSTDFERGLRKTIEWKRMTKA